MSQAHHTDDVGKILMGVQADLKALRTNLAATVKGDSGAVPTEAARKMQAVQLLVDRAEQDIKLKTEAVLHATLNEQYTTLPAIRDTNKRRATTGARGHSAGASQRLTVQDQLNSKRQMDMIMRPEGKQARQFLEERFGVTAPAAPKAKDAHKLRGTLIRKKNSEASVLPASVRGDPQGVPPKLTQKDVSRGMEDLMNRGFIPKHVDLTPAFVKMPAPVLCGQVQMHPWTEQFVKQEPYTNTLGFNLSGIKMDIVTRAQTLDLNQARARTTNSMRHAPETNRSDRTDPKTDRSIPITVVQPTTVNINANLPPSAGAGAADGAGSPRDYNQLLDEFSLHQFIIRRGSTLTNTPEFESYRRKHASAWGPIQDVINGLEQLLSRYAVPVAYVDGNKVALLSQIDFRAPSVDDMIDCLVNLDQVLELIKLPGRRYKGSNKDVVATLRLQAVYRGHLCRRGFRDSMWRFRAALTIQRLWKTVTTCRATAKIVEQVVEKRRRDFEALSKKLRQDWQLLKRRKRVVVHMPSISREEAQRVSMEDFLIRQNLQMGRLTWIASSDVEVVYVSPFPLSPDVVQYYTKFLQIQGLEHPDDRFKCVHPENYDRFPSHFALATTLLYSPRCLKRIANYCKGKEAYIIPGIVGPDDVKVATHLRMPMLSPEPQLAAVYGSKSGSKRIFSVAEVNTPPGAYDLYSEHETIHSLARLIFERLDVKVWLLKIDDEFAGRGHASLDVTQLQCHQALTRERERSMSLWLDPNKQQAALNKVVEELARVVPRAVRIAHKRLFPTWEGFLETFTRVGGVIEAVPTGAVASPEVNLLIEPSGEVVVQSTHDQVFSADYQYVGATFPQKSTNQTALRQAAMAVGKACMDKGITGYLSVDFVSFNDADGMQRLWAVDLNIGLTDTAVSFEVFRFITSGHYNAVENAFRVDVEEHPDDSRSSADGSTLDESAASGHGQAVRGYAVCDMLYHPNLATVQYNVFFNLCRLKGVHFDLQDKMGTAFLLVDSFAGGVISLLTVGKDNASSLRLLAEGLDFIQLQLGVSRSVSDKFLPEGHFKTSLKEIKGRLDAAVESAKQEREERKLQQQQSREMDLANS
uniref:IQCH-like ATP-grasp domain-containing protein n=1 Tax=Hemiselmis tepida TaxID=464990 RepID=A0A7S0VNS7_9CRYP|mmetsp:Transcript_22518/g.56852  ORF Transcript_22518/g.56852 Transcript_22518/m.56852 type:complete len:1092 (+) Transcript_22518:29-3304(+)